MRRPIILAALAVLSMSAAACSGCQPLERLNQPIAGQTVVDEKAIWFAEAGLKGLNESAKAASRAGLIQPGSVLAIQIADGLVQGRKLVDAAWTAYRLGDAKGAGEKLAEAQNLIGRIWGLIPNNGAPK